jgi:hypothetical protein
MKQLFQEEPLEKRPKLLADNATKEEVQVVKRHFKEEEIVELKNVLSTVSIQTAEAERIKSAAMKTYAADIKILDTKRRETMGKLKDGYVEQEEKLYAFADQVDGVMEYYDYTGEMVYSRKLLPSERQTRDVRLMSSRAANE